MVANALLIVGAFFAAYCVPGRMLAELLVRDLRPEERLPFSVGFGIVFGGVGGFLLALLLRVRRVVPEGLENVFTLSLVLALFQLSNAFLHESGIMSVTMAGLVVGNMRTHVSDDLKEFKEQLTVMFIGMLFVLLAADVRVADVQALGLPGLLTLASLMFVVRPINVAVCLRIGRLAPTTSMSMYGSKLPFNASNTGSDRTPRRAASSAAIAPGNASSGTMWSGRLVR